MRPCDWCGRDDASRVGKALPWPADAVRPGDAQLCRVCECLVTDPPEKPCFSKARRNALAEIARKVSSRG